MRRSLEVVHHAAPGPAVLFVHGICHGAWCWEDHYLPWFAGQGFDSYALSLRGHGGSRGREATGSTTLHGYVDDVLEVASTLPSPVALVGHSMGGAVVQLALRRPEVDFTAAVLLAPMTPGGLKVREVTSLARHPRSLWAYARLQAGRALSDEQAAALPFLSGHLAPPDAARCARRLHPEPWPALRDLLRFKPPPGAPGVPVLVIGSPDDVIFGVPALERTAAHYDAELMVLDGGCHDLMLDPTWETSARSIAGWLGDHVG